jgi:hypothetical protein
VLAHARRHILHFKATKHLSVRLVEQQLTGAFPDRFIPGYLVRVRDEDY